MSQLSAQLHMTLETLRGFYPSVFSQGPPHNKTSSASKLIAPWKGSQVGLAFTLLQRPLECLFVCSILTAADFIMRLVSSNLSRLSLGRTWRSSCMCAQHTLAWSMHYVAQELCEMGSQQGDGSTRCCCCFLSLSLFSHFLKCCEQLLTVVAPHEQNISGLARGKQEDCFHQLMFFFLYPAQIGCSDTLQQFSSVGGDLWRRRTPSLCFR